MPSYRGHLVGGVATFVITAGLLPQWLLPANTTPIALVGDLSLCLLGSLFPDIDTHSLGRRYFYYALAAGAGIIIMQKAYSLLLFFGLLAIFPLLTPHRGLTHHPLFVIISPIALLHATYPSTTWLEAVKLHHYIFFVAGALSHLLLDFAPKYLFSARVWRRKKGRMHSRW